MKQFKNTTIRKRSVAFRNLHIIQLMVNDMTKGIESNLFKTSYYASAIHTQYNRLIFLSRSRSHVR